MSDASRVEVIFFGALEKEAPAERADYLERACGGDVALRLRVERLLEAHPKAEGFLARPAAECIESDSLDEADGLTSIAPESGLEKPPREPMETTEAIETIAHERESHDATDSALRFLESSETPGSLGRLAHYEVLEVLGNGGFGTVVKAFDEKLHRLVAIKLLSPILAVTSAPRKRFVREARTAAAVRHENVVAIHAVEDHPIPYLVMEYVAGRTLQQKVEATGPLELADVLRIGWQVAAGLAAAHARGLIHRDIKPGNILLESGVEHVKITDFGLARAADDASITQSGFIAGTPMYMAPEQALGDTIDQRADLFSLGSVLYKMCTGRPPFRAANTIAVLKRVAEDTPRPIREIIPEVPEWLCDLITRLHAKNPADRPASAWEVADLLGRRLAELQGPGLVTADSEARRSAEAKPRPIGEIAVAARELRWRKHHGRHWAIAAAALVTLLGGLGLTEATGVTNFHGMVIRLFSPEGTLVVEVDDPGVSLKIDGSEIVITGAGAKEIRLKPGRYTVEARKDGKMVSRELVNVTKNGRQVVRVTQEGISPAPKAARGGSETGAWERSVADMSAHQLMKAVTARLEERNPGFQGKLDYKVEEGVVRELAVPTDCVKDISPVHALAGLKRLRVGMWNQGPGRGVLADLSPLLGLSLEELNCAATEVSDLSPLQGMPLTRLEVMGCPIASLSPLAGMPISFLDLAYVRGKVTNLEPLRGMPLAYLNLTDLSVSNLTPLKGMRSLRHLVLDGTPCSDLTPLVGLRLKELSISDTRVSDLSPLRGVELETIRLVPRKITQGLDIARNSKSLKHFKIGDDQELPAAEFWSRYDKGEFGRPKPKRAKETSDTTAWERSVSAMRAAELVKAVAARMKKLNPGFDGMILPVFDHDAVTGLQFKSDDVSDISPLRALTNLTSLKCGGTEPQKGRITDLSPLRGLRLTSLDVSQCPVSDLSPIEGMPLTEFWCGETRVNDLSPLEGMQLQYLNCIKTEVHDLTPLKGMPLEVLHLHKTKVARLTGLEGTELRELMIDNTKVFDLSPLKGLPLTTIDASSTPISDLSPLKGMKLNYFNCGTTFVSDLSPLAGMPLRCVVCPASRVTDEGVAALEHCEDLEELAINHTGVTDAGLMHLKGLKKLRLLDMMDIKATDLTPLKDLSLQRIRLTPRRLSLKGMKLLRDMDVRTIGTDWNQALPADEFWARFDKGEFR